MPGNHFPVTRSFLDEKLLAARIASEYALAGAHCQLLQPGMRDVYLVTAGEARYIFYLYPAGGRSSAEVAGEWRFVQYLYEQELPVLPAIPTAAGETVLRFVAPEGLRFAVLTPYAAGRHLRQRPVSSAAREYGQILARISVVADELEEETFDRPAHDPRLQMDQWVEAFAALFPDRQADVLFLRHAVEQLQGRLPALPKRKPYFGMIHGDAVLSNLQVNAAGNVALLDFDLCGPGWRVYDVAAFLAAVQDTAQEEALGTAFLEGYESVRPLKRPEAEALTLYQTVRAIFAIGVPAVQAAVWGRAYLQSFLEQGLERVRYYMERLD